MRSITFDDLEFDRTPVKFYSTSGVPQTRLVRVGMPRIPQHMIDGVFYLYWDKESALAGKNPGGTGFIVRYDGAWNQTLRQHYFYGVTNWHVAVQHGFSTIRLNKRDGTTDIIEFGPEDWHFIPGGADVAVVPLTIDEAIHDVSSISTREFDLKVNTGIWGPYEFGVGDDVFMIGLFIDHAGRTTNVPSARFGHVSMIPSSRATVRQPTGYEGQTYVLDMHSRTGFSGSPVYAYRTFANDLTGGHFGHEFDELDINESFGRIRGRIRVTHTLKLLGIHWGQFPEKWELHDMSRLKEVRNDLIMDGAYVEGMSGMTCVIPAHQIMEVFQLPTLQNLRGIPAQFAAPMLAPKAEVASLDSSPAAIPTAADKDANPDHLENFTRLANAASRKKPQAD